MRGQKEEVLQCFLSSFDMTLVVSFVKECFGLQIKGKFYFNRKLFCSFCVI